MHGHGQFVGLRLALGRVVFHVVAIEHIGGIHRVFDGIFHVRIAPIRCTGTCTGRGLCRCERVHVIEDNVFRVIVVEQQGMFSRTHPHDVTFGCHVQDVVGTVLVIYLYAQPVGSVGTQLVVVHTEPALPCGILLPVGTSLAGMFPFLFIHGFYMHVRFRSMCIVIETQVLVFAGRKHRQHSCQQGNVSYRVFHHFIPPFLLLLLPRPSNHTREISAFVGPNQWRFFVVCHT